jgi:hypothetical protein
MSTMANGTMSVGRPMGSSDTVWIPCMGGLWVVINVALLGLGSYINWPISSAFMAGLINGTLLSVIAVAKASERFQAGTTGLLGGLSLSGLRHDGSMVSKGMDGLHGFVDNAFHALGIDGLEKLHHTIEQQTLYMVWTAIFVIMASLVAEWMRSVRQQG